MDQCCTQHRLHSEKLYKIFQAWQGVGHLYYEGLGIRVVQEITHRYNTSVQYHEIPATINVRYLARYMPQNVSYSPK